LLSLVSYEFPALIGGVCGFIVTLVAANRGIGLAPNSDARPKHNPATSKSALVKATFPLWGSVLVLVVTRIPQLGIKSLLTDKTSALQIGLGSFGELSISRAAVVSLTEIFGSIASWSFETLYVPSLIPFGLISIISIIIYRMRFSATKKLITETFSRMFHPVIALLGALVMVKLLMVGEGNSMVILIGKSFAFATGDNWIYAAAFLGALGSFFSGSATISNLTFGGIQYSIANELKLDPAIILSMQSVGAAFGNMICINNIVAVCSILGITNREGEILRKTIAPMFLYGLIAVAVGQFL
jgi:lactate permease